jgi:ribosomal-protein-alanine N-acetyltransferase
MAERFKLRKFTVDDLQAVMKINRLCLPENYMDSFFIDLYRRFPETFVIAEENGEVVGYIMCRMEVGLSSIGLGGVIRKSHIVSIATLPEHRREGIANAIITKTMEAMREYKAKQCYLEVRLTNDPAVNLYKKLGFEVTRTIHGYYADGEDAYVMTKKL